MVIEYIKRNQRMGYEGDKLVYKVGLDEEAPITPDKIVLAPTKTDTLVPIEEESTPQIEPEVDAES